MKNSDADSEEEEVLDKEEEEEVLMLQQNMAARLDENDFDIEEFEVMQRNMHLCYNAIRKKMTTEVSCKL
jgi:hypothetical protein